MLTLEQAKKLLTPEDYEKFEILFWISQSEEFLSPQWYTTREMMQDIVMKNNCDDGDPFDFGVTNKGE